MKQHFIPQRCIGAPYAIVDECIDGSMANSVAIIHSQGDKPTISEFNLEELLILTEKLRKLNIKV